MIFMTFLIRILLDIVNLTKLQCRIIQLENRVKIGVPFMFISVNFYNYEYVNCSSDFGTISQILMVLLVSQLSKCMYQHLIFNCLSTWRSSSVSILLSRTLDLEILRSTISPSLFFFSGYWLIVDISLNAVLY